MTTNRDAAAGFWQRVRYAREEGRLFKRVAHAAATSRYVFVNPANQLVRLESPGWVEPPRDDLPLIERLFESFVKMKRAEQHAPARFRQSSMWEDTLGDAFAPLRDAFKRDDVEPFRFFLANFGAWDRYTGITWSTYTGITLDPDAPTRRFLGRPNLSSRAQSTSHRRADPGYLPGRILQNETYLKLYKLWNWMNSGRKPVDALDQPRHGNQSGAYIDGTFVTIPSFAAEVYGELLGEITRAVEPKPVIAELGAGYGNLAYYLLSRLNRYTFVDFDLPEVLVTAAYFLAKAFPDRKVLLYGESDFQLPEAATEYDLVFMPSYELARVPASCIDLFMNVSSLGEMPADVARAFVADITRATRYFFHSNHDRRRNVYKDGSQGLLAHEYPIPSDRFRLVTRYPELFSSSVKGFLNFGEDYFVHLYKRSTGDDGR